jgi:LacI family transcriptional regulator
VSELHRVTLADIAREANVHVTTVSLALRDHRRIPETTKKRIRELADKLGYTPDPLLSALSSYRIRSRSPRFQSTIAYLTNWDSEWGWKKMTAHPYFFTGAEKAARKLGFGLEHFWLRSPELTEAQLNKIFRARNITGLILASHEHERGDVVRLNWSDFSCVKIDYFPHEPLVHNVTNYQTDIIRVAMRRAYKSGYRRIGFVMHRAWDLSVDSNWMAGYLCEMQRIEEKNRLPAYIFSDKNDKENFVPDAEDFEKWRRRHKPDVILSNGTFVRPVFAALKLEIPEDIAFVDLFLTDFTGATAGVRQNHEHVGAIAVKTIASELNHNERGIPEFPTTTFVEGTWFDGASCPSRSRL